MGGMKVSQCYFESMLIRGLQKTRPHLRAYLTGLATSSKVQDETGKKVEHCLILLQICAPDLFLPQ